MVKELHTHIVRSTFLHLTKSHFVISTFGNIRIAKYHIIKSFSSIYIQCFDSTVKQNSYASHYDAAGFSLSEYL